MESNSKIISVNNIIINKSTTDYRFKIVYTIAMLSVIAEHCRGRGSIELNIQNWFNYSSYHMPLFMFSAGYFFKTKYVEDIYGLAGTWASDPLYGQKLEPILTNMGYF